MAKYDPNELAQRDWSHKNTYKKYTVKEVFREACDNDKHAYAVPLNMSVPALYQEILYKLHCAGYEKPVMFGGALRDEYLKQKNIEPQIPTSDLDIAIPIPENFYENFSEHNKEALKDIPAWLRPAASTDTFIEELLQIEGIEEAGIYKSDTYQDFELCISAKYKADNGSIHNLDLCVSSAHQRLAPNLAKMGDAPINSIALDYRGNITCHNKFESHASRKIYQFIDIRYGAGTRDEIRHRDEVRFKALKEKIPNLVHIGHNKDFTLDEALSEPVRTINKVRGRAAALLRHVFED